MNVSQKIQESLYSSTILIADDDEMIRLLLAAYLENAKFEKIEFAENGADALEKITHTHPACVIMDINMPVMDGIEALQRIRANPETEDIPVLVVTGHDNRKERNRILHAGATNLISKPIESDILIDRVTNLIERKLLVDQLSQFHERLTLELALAAEMQIDLMPGPADIHNVETLYGISFASHFRSSSELGGDSWSLQIIDDDCFGILVVDFSGHGVSAALNTFRLNTVINRMGVCKSSPAEYIAALNEEIVQIIPVDQFCTMLYAIIDIKNNTLTYSGAATPSPIFGQIKEADVVIGDGSGIPVGIQSQVEYKNHAVEFPKGSFLFLYSDALPETESINSGPLDTDGVASLTKQHRSSHAETALNNILSSFYETAPKPLPDDLTAIWVSR